MAATDTATTGTGEGPVARTPVDHRPTLAHERRLWKEGHRWVAGLDEVGRGAWAGPVTVGVALIRPGVRRNGLPRWLRDSKLLSEDRRERLFDEVVRWCAAWGVGHAEADECDRWGMTAALRLAAYRALEAMGTRPDALIVDGPRDLLRAPAVEVVELPLGPMEDDVPARLACRRPGPPPLPDVVMPEVVVPLVDADALCASVSAASVLAKVVRDRRMRQEAPHYPPYAFEQNKGYPSPVHQVALRGYGCSAIHRRSWAFVEDLPWV